MSKFAASIKEIDQRISWVLEHRAMSCWLKDALKSALNRDPIAVINDLEILSHLLRARSEMMLRQTSDDLSGADDDMSSGQTK